MIFGSNNVLANKKLQASVSRSGNYFYDDFNWLEKDYCAYSYFVAIKT